MRAVVAQGAAGPAAHAAGARLRFRPGDGRSEPPAWLVLPPGPRRGPPLVAVHGITRNAEAIAERLALRATRAGRVLIAPLFAEDAFPGYQRVLGRRRADRALLALLEGLRREGVVGDARPDLGGFSGGAQFAHRFAWLYPHRVGRLVVASAGWWTFPDAAAFPYGLGDGAYGPAARWFRANARAFLDREIRVVVGGADDAPDPNTRSGPAIDAQQGPHRLERARRWTAALTAAAAAAGLPPRVSLSVLPGAGHDFLDCADVGLDALMLPDPADRRSLPNGA